MLSCFRLRVSVHYLLLVYLDLMRCQQVIDACISLGEGSPIQNSHDVGAGGLPELVHDSGLGAKFEIRDVPVADSSMSPMEIWCNESQERYVLTVLAEMVSILYCRCCSPTFPLLPRQVKVQGSMLLWPLLV
jgi:hypothetical protein